MSITSISHQTTHLLIQENGAKTAYWLIAYTELVNRLLLFGFMLLLK